MIHKENAAMSVLHLIFLRAPPIFSLETQRI